MIISKKLTFAVYAMGIMILGSCMDQEILPESDLPSEILTYVDTHFPENDILQIERERHGIIKRYKVILEENINLEFNGKMEVIEIEGGTKLPDSVIPAEILTYVGTNYPENDIIAWELEGRDQQVELDNGLELKFNMDGEFLRID
ncbi:MAG: PepSY-like domain-containing protein [Cyclobacteriaceae bacterium]